MDVLPAALTALIAATPSEQFAAGATLIAPDARSAPLWFVHEGLVRLYALDANGGSYTLEFFGAGELVSGRLQLRNGRICCDEQALGVAALQTTRAAPLTLAQLDQLRQRDESSAAWLLDRLLQVKAEGLTRQSDLVQRSAAERYAQLLRKRPGILEQVPLQEIAAWLGITAVALSRIRRRLHTAQSD